MAVFYGNLKWNAQSIRLKNNLENGDIIKGQGSFWDFLEMQLIQGKVWVLREVVRLLTA